MGYWLKQFVELGQSLGVTLLDGNLSISQGFGDEPKIPVLEVMQPEYVLVKVRQGRLLKQPIKAGYAGQGLQFSSGLNVIAQAITAPSSTFSAGGATVLPLAAGGSADLGLTGRTGFCDRCSGITGSGRPHDCNPLSGHYRSLLPVHTGRSLRTGTRCCQNLHQSPGQS